MKLLLLFLFAWIGPPESIDPVESLRFEIYRPRLVQALALSQAHYDFIHAQPRWPADWTREVDDSHWCWILLDGVLNPQSENEFEVCLWLLKDALGPLDFAAAKMPRPMPIQRFVDRERP